MLDHLLLADHDGMNQLLETYPGLLDDPRVASRYAHETLNNEPQPYASAGAPQAPRIGLTMVMDKAEPPSSRRLPRSQRRQSRLAQLGFGTSIATPNVKEKIKLYHDAGLMVYPGGTLFEAFLSRTNSTTTSVLWTTSGWKRWK